MKTAIESHFAPFFSLVICTYEGIYYAILSQVKYEDVLFFIDACSLKESSLTYPGDLESCFIF
jgi:hypothetical protein